MFVVDWCGCVWVMNLVVWFLLGVVSGELSW